MPFLTRKSPTGLSPFTNEPFFNFQKEMNQLMENFFSDSWNRWPETSEEMKNLSQWTPRVDVSETEKEYKVTAELPGLSEKDIDVSFQENTLFIKGEKKFEKKEGNENFHRLECSYGSFYRAIPFATQINEDQIAADYDKGVLTIKLGKSEETVSKTRKINVKKINT